ncbi:MAG: glycerol-3-phosphate dehydrogenase, partial [Hyphomicrobiales bacterium]
MAEIVILGAGVMGSAMSVPAGARGHAIKLVGTHLDEEIVRSVAGNGLHPRLGITLPPQVKAHAWTELGAALTPRTDLVILGVSSAGVGWAIERLVETLRGPVPVVMITKGLAARDGAHEAVGGLGLMA